MVSNSSAKYYQKNKERYKKSLVKGIKIFLKKKKNMVANNIKIFPIMKNKGWLCIEKIIFKCRKMPRNNIQMYVKDWLISYFTFN